MNPQPEAGSVAKNLRGKVKVHVFRYCIRRVLQEKNREKEA